MDLKKLSRKTGLPVRRLRYVVDQRVAPCSLVAVRGKARAQARQLSESNALLVALAASLLEAGVKSDLTRVAVEAVSEYRCKQETRRYTVFAESILDDGVNGWVEIADNRFVKFDLGESWTSGWLDCETLNPCKAEQPHRVVIRVDVSHIAKMIWQEE